MQIICCFIAIYSQIWGESSYGWWSTLQLRHKIEKQNTLIKSFNLEFALCVAFGFGVCEYEEDQRALWECLVGF
jgi:hypothetical protein